MTDRSYVYLGDRYTRPGLKGQRCRAVLRSDGKCIRGRNANMLVAFGHEAVVVNARRLRRVKA